MTPETDVVSPGSSPSLEDIYDPYVHRVGNIGTVYAFLHLVKSSIGSGVLSMPQGFKNAGMAGGLVIAVVVTTFVVGCFLIMINTMVKIAGEKKVPLVTLKEAAKYSMEHSHKCLARYATAFGILIDVMMLINYVGTCASYFNYVVATTLRIFGDEYVKYGEGPPNAYRVAVAAAWIGPFYAINCFRNMKALAPTSMIGNVLIMAALLSVIVRMFLPDDEGEAKFSEDWRYLGEWEIVPLFIGMMIFSVGSIGVGISVEKEMKNAKKFVGWFGVYNVAMWSTVFWYLIVSVLGYLKYGEKTQASIVWNIPSGPLAIAAQCAVGLALFFSYPLMCFVIFELTWVGIAEPKIPTRKTMWEYLYRLFVTVFIAVIAVVVPRLDIALGVVGSFSLGFLTVVMPGILEYNYIYGKYGWKEKRWVLAKDVFILAVGCLFWFIGTYSSVYAIVLESLK